MGDNTNRDLARAMAKPWSKTQMVTRRRVGQIVREWNTRQVFQGWMLQGMSKIVFKSFQRVIKKGQRLKIIELENYNSAEELSIEKGNTESLGLIRQWNTGPDSKRTTAAVHMKGKRVATRLRDRAAYMWPLIGNETGPGNNGPVERKGHQQKEVC